MSTIVAAMRKQLTAKADELEAIVRGSVEADRDLTETEKRDSDALRTAIEGLDSRIAQAVEDDRRAARHRMSNESVPSEDGEPTKGADPEKMEMGDDEEHMERAANKRAAALEHLRDPVKPGEIREVAGGAVIYNPEPADRMSFSRDTRGNAFTPAKIPEITRDLVYEPDGDHGFIRDSVAAFLGKSGARERLARHEKVHEPVMRQATIALRKRAVTSDNLGGQVVPQYLSDMVARYPTGGRPLLDFLGSRDLPDIGIIIHVPRITTPPSVDAQATEGTAFSTQDVDDTLLDVNVRMYAGTFPVSVQAVERGVMTEDILWQALMDQLDEKQDTDVLNADGTAGRVKGLLRGDGVKTAYTSGTPDFKGLWPKFTENIGSIWTQRKRSPNLHLMAPRRWTDFSGALDDSGRPVMMPSESTAYNPLALGPSAAEFGIVGRLSTGFRALVDANMPTNLGAGTNEDWLVSMRTNDILFWESPVVTMLVEQRQATSGLVDLVARRYMAFTSEWQPKAVGWVHGTGMVI